VAGSAWGAIIDLPGTTTGPQPCLITIKVAEGKIIRNWDTLRLRGTVSNGLQVENVFVPWHRIFPAGAVKNDAQPMGGDYDPEEPVYRVPYMPAGAMASFSAIAVGTVQRLHKELHERIRTRQRVVLGRKEWESLVAQCNVGEVTTWVEQIEALHARYAGQIESWSRQGIPLVPEIDSNRLGA